MAALIERNKMLTRVSRQERKQKHALEKEVQQLKKDMFEQH